MRRIALAALLACGCGQSISFPSDGGQWAFAPVPEFSKQQRIIIDDNGQDDLAVVSMDLPQPKLLGMVPIGDNPVELEGPHHIALSPDGQTLYVNLSNYVPGSGSGPHGSHGTGTVPGSLVRLRASDYQETGEALVDRSPGDVIVTRDGKTAYVSHYDLLRLTTQIQMGLPPEQGYSAIAVVDTQSMARPPLYPICPTAHGMVLSSDEKTLYATCAQSDELAIFDTTTHAVTRVAVGPAPGSPGQPRYAPYSVARSPADQSLWISCNNSGELRVFDTAQNKMDDSRTVFVNGVPLFSAFLSDGKTLLAPHQGDDKISIVDTAQAMELATIALPAQACLNVHVVIVTPDDQTAYAVCEGDHVSRQGTLVAINVPARTVVGWVEVGIFPDGIVIAPPAM